VKVSLGLLPLGRAEKVVRRRCVSKHVVTKQWLHDVECIDLCSITQAQQPEIMFKKNDDSQTPTNAHVLNCSSLVVPNYSACDTSL